MKSLTVKQKINLFHVLFIFPLIFINLYPEILGQKRILRYLLLFMTTMGSFYHVYLFFYINNKSLCI